jgi:SAM-dependent methyltransferase
MENKSDYPDYVARFYDLIYSQLRTIDRDYFLGKILETRGPVLEIGVGTGRLFLEALNRGADIDGIDNSASMLAKLKEKLDQRHHNRIVLQDARAMNLPRKYDLIVAPFRVFSHLIDMQDQIQVLNNVYDHLNRNGRFIFDLYVPDLNILLHGIKEQVDFEGEYQPGKKLRRVVSAKPDLIKQVSLVTMTFAWEEDDYVRTEAWQTPMRFYFRYELEHLVHRSKLTLKHIYGDYQENELHSHSKDFIVICERKD